MHVFHCSPAASINYLMDAEIIQHLKTSTKPPLKALTATSFTLSLLAHITLLPQSQ